MDTNRSACTRRAFTTRWPVMVSSINPFNAPSAVCCARKPERVRGVFTQVDERLRGGRRFLVGDRFTAADLTFAALAAPVLLPAECRAAAPALEAVPATMREEILRLRDTDAGQFALRLFAQERGHAA